MRATRGVFHLDKVLRHVQEGKVRTEGSAKLALNGVIACQIVGSAKVSVEAAGEVNGRAWEAAACLPGEQSMSLHVFDKFSLSPHTLLQCDCQLASQGTLQKGSCIWQCIQMMADTLQTAPCFEAKDIQPTKVRTVIDKIAAITTFLQLAMQVRPSKAHQPCGRPCGAKHLKNGSSPTNNAITPDASDDDIWCLAVRLTCSLRATSSRWA